MILYNSLKEGDIAKYHAVQEKHWRMWEKAGDFEKAAGVLKEISKVCEEKGEGQKKKEATSALIRMLSNPSSIDTLSNDLLSVLRSALEASVVSDGTDASVQNQENFKALIKLLYKTRDMRSLLGAAVTMLSAFPQSSYPLEWICKVHLEYVCDTLDFTSEELEGGRMAGHVSRLLERNANSTLGKLSGGAVEWNRGKGDARAARDALKSTIGDSGNPNFYGAYILSFCHVELAEYAECEAMVAVALGMLEAKVL